MIYESELFKSIEDQQAFYHAYDQTLSQWDVPFQSRFIQTSYGKVHVLSAGTQNEKPLILFHGFGFSSAMWYKNAHELSKRYAIYAVDVLGEFNKSVVSRHLNKKEDYIVWINELLKALDLSKASFAGHSNGGWHALNYSLSCPEKVEKLILLAPAASIIPMKKEFHFRLMLCKITKNRRVVMNYFCRWLESNENPVDSKLYEQYYLGARLFKWTYLIHPPDVFIYDDLKSLPMPVLLLVGSKEVIYPVDKLISAARSLFPICEVDVIEGAGHMLPIEKAKEVNKRIIQFLLNSQK